MLFRSGVILQNHGDLKAAETQFRQAITLKPSDLVFRRNLAGVLQERGNKQEAERVLKEALEIDPRFADAHRALGTLLLERGALPEAEMEFVVLLQLVQEDADAEAKLGDVYTAQKRYAEAADAYRQALKWAKDQQLQREIQRKLARVEKMK